MNEDPIVAEVRQIRRKRAEHFGYDIHQIFADLIRRGQVTDTSHPLVANAGQWLEDMAARDALVSREESPRKD